jgi:hypothetical protein
VKVCAAEPTGTDLDHHLISLGGGALDFLELEDARSQDR